jgi:hypothetical protein
MIQYALSCCIREKPTIISYLGSAFVKYPFKTCLIVVIGTLCEAI